MSDNNGNGPDNNDSKKTPTENPKETPKIPPSIPPKLGPSPNPPPTSPNSVSDKDNPYKKFTKEVVESAGKRLLTGMLVDLVKGLFRRGGGVATEAVFQAAKEPAAATDRIATRKRLHITGKAVQALEYAADSKSMDKEVLFKAVENIKNRQWQAVNDGDDRAKSSLRTFGISDEEIVKLSPDLLFKRILNGVEPGKVNKARLDASAYLLGDQFDTLRKYFNRDIPGEMYAFDTMELAISDETTRNVARFNQHVEELKGYGKTAYQGAKDYVAYRYNKSMDFWRSSKATASAAMSKLYANVISGGMNIIDGTTMYATQPFVEKSDTIKVLNENSTISLGAGNGAEEAEMREFERERAEANQNTEKNKKQKRLTEEMRAAEESQAATRRLESYGQLNLTDSSANSISSNLAPQLLDNQTAMLSELRELTRAVERNTQIIDQVLGGQ